MAVEIWGRKLFHMTTFEWWVTGVSVFLILTVFWKAFLWFAKAILPEGKGMRAGLAKAVFLVLILTAAAFLFAQYDDNSSMVPVFQLALVGELAMLAAISPGTRTPTTFFLAMLVTLGFLENQGLVTRWQTFLVLVLFGLFELKVRASKSS